MTKPPSSSVVTAAITVAVAVTCLILSSPVNALGSGGTFAVVDGSDTVCALVAGQPTQRILCYDTRRRTTVAVDPGVSFSSIAAGENSLCAIRSGGYSLLCWDNIRNYDFNPKRIYQNDAVLLETIAIGDHQVCATVNGTSAVKCWRTQSIAGESPPANEGFRSVSSGFGFTCGVSIRSSQIRCWGSNPISGRIQNGFGNMTMLSISAGGSHACGLNSTQNLVCIGNNESGQLNIPSNSDLEYSGLSLGSNFTCATRKSNGSVICWGSGTERFNNVTERVSFQSISSGSGLTCGLISGNLSIMCWNPSNFSRFLLPFPEILPGPCVESSRCVCGIYPQSDRLCSGSGSICSSCQNNFLGNPPPPLVEPPSAPSPESSPSKGLTRGLLAFAIIGSVGAFSGFCTLVYCLWTGVCLGKKKIHNSVQPTITRGGSNNNNNGSRSNSSPPSRSLTIRRQGSRMLTMRRQRSGTSSKHADKAEEFSFSELAIATGNFSLENKIGSGSFGIVYRGRLSDGREVAIKRGETSAKTKKFQEKETAFESELAFLSRLHHKHLVRLVGYCEEKEERLLVYDYMKNGALFDHLHDKNNVEKHSSLINSWKMRIRIALDAARGIEYLHNYAVPPIIHRDIKSSNILLDSNWTARVSDFGLSLMGPESGKDHHRPMKAAGTVGYIDPEYYSLNVLTDKSDVYGLGVVLLELLTGKRAIFKNGSRDRDGDDGNAPIHLVDYAVPAISNDELGRVLDQRVGPPELGEAEAVELVAYTATHCVNSEGRNRPTMTDIVANLERALDLCGDSHGSISSGIISIVSE